MLNADKILERLRSGNKRYLTSEAPSSDVSLAARIKNHDFGQKPYAVIVTCSDSRIMPEAIFSAGLGELFVIRNAGHIIGDYELGSIEYGVRYLGARLVLVLGHTCCGAVNAAIDGISTGYIRAITQKIGEVIGEEKDEKKCVLMNIEHSIKQIKESELVRKLVEQDELQICGGIYDIKTGEVEFL